jgi:hypothetical protein
MKFSFNENTIPAMIAGASAGVVLSSAVPSNPDSPMVVPVLCAAFLGAVNGLLQSRVQSSPANHNHPSPNR